MERKLKHDIIKMLIPFIGTWWLIKQILPDLDDITWWDYSKYSIPLTLVLVFYQAICWIGCKVFHMIYFCDYEFVEVFTKW